MIHLASPTSHIPESNDQKLHTLCSAIEKSSKADTIMIDSDIVPGSKYSSTSRQTRKHSDNEQYTTPIEPKLVKPDVKPIISIKDSNSVTRLNKRFHNSPFHKKGSNLTYHHTLPLPVIPKLISLLLEKHPTSYYWMLLIRSKRKDAWLKWNKFSRLVVFHCPWCYS